MNLLVPVGLALGITLPVVVIFYLLKVRYRDHEVGSTYLWAQLTRDLAVHEPWQRPRFSVLASRSPLLAVAEAADPLGIRRGNQPPRRTSQRSVPRIDCCFGTRR